MDDAQLPDIPGLTDSRMVGEGGFGRVFAAHQTAFDREVAVKILDAKVTDPAGRARFERECLALGKLSAHPNIVTVFSSGFAADRPYLTMEFVPGGSLSDKIGKDGPLAPEKAVAVSIALAGALETAHRAGVLHRDVKPENVLLSTYGEPLLADFGIARLEGGPSTTSTGKVTTSIAHAAPEVLDAGTPEASWDTYALASTLFTALVGRYAFVEKDMEMLAILRRILEQPVPDLRPEGVPDAVAQVVERGMAKRSADRYGSALAMGRALQAVQRAAGWNVTSLLVPGEPAEGEDVTPPTVTVAPGAFQAPPQVHTPAALPPQQTGDRALLTPPAQPPAARLPQQPTGGYPQQPAATGGYPQQQAGGYPQQPTGGYPQQQPAAAGGYTAPARPPAYGAPGPPSSAPGDRSGGGGRTVMVAIAVLLGLSVIGVGGFLALRGGDETTTPPEEIVDDDPQPLSGGDDESSRDADGPSDITGPFTLPVDGQPRSGEVVVGEETIFLLQLSEGESITIAVTSTLIDPVIELRDPDGRVVGTDDDGGEGTNSLLDVTAQTAGQYTLAVTDFLENDAGPFRVTAGAGGMTDIEEFVGEILNEFGVIAVADGVERFEVEGFVGERIQVSVFGVDPSPLDPFVTVFDPNGNEIGSDDDGGEGLNSLFEFAVTEEGIHAFDVSGFVGGTGDFQIVISVL